MKKTKLLIAALLLFGFGLLTFNSSAQYTQLRSFGSSPTDGNGPQESLISIGTFLYGVTQLGGSSNLGCLFKIKPDGTGYTNVLNFTGTNGRNPSGSLFYDGTFLYGMANKGGTGPCTNGCGVIYKVRPDGTGDSVLLNFGFFSVTGTNPTSSLVSDGNFLYGMTNLGGGSNMGTIFKVRTNGTGYSQMHDFSGADGNLPFGSLIFVGNVLYGMTQQGGTHSMGNIFKIMPDGSGFTDLLDFSASSGGNWPKSKLFYDGTFLYGMTGYGGNFSDGVLFKVNPDGTGYTDLINFSGAANGTYPGGSLFYDGTFFYAMASGGGTHSSGVVFKIKPNGTGFTKLHDFSGATTDGGNPSGTFISDGTFLYGMCTAGGTNYVGTVFKYNMLCTPVTLSQSPTICTGQSVTVGTHTYTTQGTYKDTLTTYSGCDSTVTTILTVNTTPTITGTTPAGNCGTGTVTLGAAASAGTINWYAALTGGPSLGTGVSFTTPSISSTTTYYVDASNGNCISASRTAVIATINTTIPTVTGNTPAARCDAGTVTLGAAASAGTLNWYAAASGGPSLGTGVSFTTPSISSTTIYYVDATNSGCTTASRTAVTATVNTTPTVTGSTPAARCDAGTVTLGAAASAGILNWYAASTGGPSLGTGISFTTPSISSTTPYYVDAANSGCTTASRTAVTATVNTTPTVTGSTPAARCDAGTVTLGAAASAGILNWYAASTGGPSLGTGISFTSPSISSTTPYYVDASNSGCISPSRTAVTATVNTTPSVTGTTPAARCDAGTVILGAAASAGTLNWYALSTGGVSLGTGTAFTTPSISTTTTYYVDAVNSGCTSASRTAVIAAVNTTPTITGTTPAGHCGTGTVTLGAAASAGTINWYAASTGGPSLGTGVSFTTPSISTTTTYYVDASNGNCTSASRTAVIATINTTIPTVTGTTPAARCDAGTITLGAAASAGILNWYSAATGGPSLGTGVSFTTPSISSTTPYYVDATNSGCTTASRTSVTATVNTTPTVTNTTPAARCDAGTVNLGASSTGTLNWYAAPTGGPSLGTGTSFTTPSISNTTPYYVDATNNGCTSSSRITVAATINITPTVTGTTPAARCDAGTAILGGTASAGTLNWYAASTGGPSLGTGISFTTPSISNTTPYYVDASNNGCTSSSRTTVTATINTTPTVTGTTPAARCDAGTVTLIASASTGTLNWYAAPTGGTSLGTGISYTTPSISSTTTYYVDASANSCTTGSRSAVIATVNTTPTVNAGADVTICAGQSVTLTASGTASNYSWDNSVINAVSFIPTGNNTYTVTGTLNGCSATDAVIVTVNPLSSITGNVIYSQGIVAHGSALLFNADSSGAIPAVQTSAIDLSGNYTFTNVHNGNYKIQIVPDTSVYHTTIMKTYFAGAFLWDSASVITVSCGTNNTANITAVYLAPLAQTSSALISGVILADANYVGLGAANNNGEPRSLGDPIPNVDVSLKQTPGGIIATTHTAANGTYQFSHVPLGTFIILASIPGYGLDSTRTAIVSSVNADDINENYFVSDSTIYPNVNVTTGVKQLRINSLSVYPNPAANSIIIGGINSKSVIKLYDVFGKLVLDASAISITKNAEVIINTSILANGIYTLVSENADSRAVCKVVISR